MLHLPLLLGALSVCAADEPPHGPLWETYQRAERLGSAAMDELVARDVVQPRWLEGNDRFWYRLDLGEEREFVLVDAAQGARAPAFDHARLAAALSDALKRKIDPRRLPFREIAFAEDGARLHFRVGEQGWRCDLRSYALEQAALPEPPAVPAAPPAPEQKPGESPNRRWTAFVRDGSLWLRAEAGAEHTLSADGDPGHPYGPWSWSPDSRRLAAWRTTPGDNLAMYVVESSPKEGLRPKLRQYTYPLPGDRLDRHELRLFEVDPPREVKVDADPVETPNGLPELRWKPDSARLTYEHTDRGNQRVRVLEVDAATGAVRTVIEERSPTFVWPPCHALEYLDDTDEIVWAAERDGWNHLYLIDERTGAVKNRITQGEWVVRQLGRIDRAGRWLEFAAGGREAGQDPYLLHWYRVNLDGSGLASLSPANGQHSLRPSPDGRFHLDTWSRVDQPPVTELRRSADGGLVCRVEEADIGALTATGWRLPEPFVAPGRDRTTPIHGVIWRPSRLDEAQRYPVIEDIYAGPQGSFVPHTFSASGAHFALAELGFVVVQIDGMGTANRAKAFHDVAWHDLGDSGFPDRIAWLRAAAAKYPYMDLTRVGIYGMSAGGYNAARALIACPEVYRVAVALAGNHDHRTDKAWWNELWMGYPVGPHYAAQSNVVNADKLRGKLLLVHGELDDNVNPSAATLQFANALIRANCDFELLLVPGAGHGFGAYVQRRMWDWFVRWLRGEEPPAAYPLKQAGGSECEITVRNALAQPAAIYWIDFEGKLRKYHDLQPGQEIRQHTFIGHQWEAQVDGVAVSWYRASAAQPAWAVGE
ncbi:MAG: prolyl oligopeptidase family serine peptidase [Armatimonadetes bacterium]|nr:prolyl oligopeptidase family serine peptidase [Armatimonadota bacterium]